MLINDITNNILNILLTSRFSRAKASWPSPDDINVVNNFFEVFWQAFFINSTRFSAVCNVSERASVLPDLEVEF